MTLTGHQQRRLGQQMPRLDELARQRVRGQRRTLKTEPVQAYQHTVKYRALRDTVQPGRQRKAGRMDPRQGIVHNAIKGHDTHRSSRARAWPRPAFFATIIRPTAARPDRRQRPPAASRSAMPPRWATDAQAVDAAAQAGGRGRLKYARRPPRRSCFSRNVPHRLSRAMGRFPAHSSQARKGVPVEASCRSRRRRYLS